MEDLAQQALDMGYVVAPKDLKEIDGEDIVKVE